MAVSTLDNQIQDQLNNLNSKINDKFIVITITVITSGTVTMGQESINISYSGYTPIGVIGHREYSSVSVYYYNLFINGTTNLEVSWRTIDSSTVANHKVDVFVLYKKNN